MSPSLFDFMQLLFGSTSQQENREDMKKVDRRAFVYRSLSRLNQFLVDKTLHIRHSSVN